MAPHLKRPVQPRELLGRQKMPMTMEEKKAAFAKLWEKHEKRLKEY